MSKPTEQAERPEEAAASVLHVNAEGRVEVSRAVLHASEGYKRQVAALNKLAAVMKAAKSKRDAA